MSFKDHERGIISEFAKLISSFCRRALTQNELSSITVQGTWTLILWPWHINAAFSKAATKNLKRSLLNN